MSYIQILAIVLGSLFFVMLMLFIIVFAHNKKSFAQQSERLAKMYSDPNLAKMDYDFVIGDDETELLLARAQNRNNVNTVNSETEQQLSFLGGSDTEGIEEITGNYKP